MSEIPSIKELQKLRVVDLKERLSKLGASISGLKADLVARLHETLVELNDAEAGTENSPENESNIENPESNDNSEDVDPEKILLEQQKEALALEQVRMLEEEKIRLDNELIERGKQQQQLLEGQEAGLRQEEMLMVETQQHMIAQMDVERVEKGKQQHMLIEQQQEQERIMVATQKIMLAQEEHIKEENEKTMLAEQQHQILQQQKFEEEQAMNAAAVLQQQIHPPPVHSLSEPLIPFVPVIQHKPESVIMEPMSIPQTVIIPTVEQEILPVIPPRSRIPHSGPQTTIPMNPLMTLAAISTTPLTTMAGPTYVTPSRIIISSNGAQIPMPRVITHVPTIVTSLPPPPSSASVITATELVPPPPLLPTSVAALMPSVVEMPMVAQAGLPMQISSGGLIIPPNMPPQMSMSIPPPNIAAINSMPPNIISSNSPSIQSTTVMMQDRPIMIPSNTTAPMMTPVEMNEPLLPLPIPQSIPILNTSIRPPIMMQPPMNIPIMNTGFPNPSLLPIPLQGNMPPNSLPMQMPMQSGPPTDVSSAPLLPLPPQPPIMSSSDMPLLPNPPSEMPLLPLPPRGPQMNNIPSQVGMPPTSQGLLQGPPRLPGTLQPPPMPPPSISGMNFDNNLGHLNQEASEQMYDRSDQMMNHSSHMMDRHEEEEDQDDDGRFDENRNEHEEDMPYHLPSAIEKVLALQNERAQQEDLDAKKKAEESREEVPKQPVPIRSLVSVDEEEDDMDEEETPAAPTHTHKQPKESKNKRRKEKKKRARQRKIHQKEQEEQRENEESDKPKDSSKKNDIDVEIDYVPDTMEPKDPLYFQFLRIFEKFKLVDPDKQKEELSEEKLKELARQEEIMNRLAERKKPADIDEKDDDDDDDKKEEEKPKLSKRKLKKLNRMSVAELKQKVGRPELVEMHDVTAKDPILLLHLKAARNSVPVPRHWCFKRKYLQGKRGIEKPPFNLPEFIKKTGIMEMRQALQEKEEQKTMKAKMRERVRPKMGKIDIDYQKLHDAFFKWQIKPRMTIHGDLYYEGKEFETRLKEKKPGELSEDLRMALGMPVGPNQHRCPPPWLIAMQRYGPPPSYPNLKIPGLNAPIPDSCSFGYHAGGWGKPPVDEMGRPLYGDVFGTQLGDGQLSMLDEEVDRSLWGELESESSDESEEESEEEEEEEKQEDETGLVTPAEGLVTPSGLSSVPTGMETPDMIELRKRKIEAEMEGGETPALYTILPEKQMDKVGASMMGSTHIYDMTAAMPAAKARGVTGAIAAMMPPQGVEVTLDPSELEMDSAAMAARYEQTVREQQSQLAKEDLSDMVAEHAARQKNKRKKQQQDTSKTSKKYKEFKF